MPLRLTKRLSIIAAFVLQVCILGGLALFNSDVVLFGDVLTIQTLPMSPQNIRSASGVQLEYGLNLDTPGRFLALEQHAPKLWKPHSIHNDAPDCLDCRFLQRLPDRRFGLSHYSCTPDEATRLERDLRMAALEKGTSGRPLLVEIVVYDDQVQRIRSVRVAPTE